MANDKGPYILISLYESLYKQKYNKSPRINKFREKWGMQDVIDSVGYERAKELIEYYFKINKFNHPLQFFFYNFDRIDRMQKDIQNDRIHRDHLREETRKLVEGIE